MSFIHDLILKFRQFWAKCQPVFRRIGQVLSTIGKNLGILWKYIYKLRAFFLAVPVAAAAVIQAMRNMERLPDTVEYSMLHLDLHATETLFGPFVLTVEQLSREAAVTVALTLTAVCLLFTIFSKRTLFPWIVSLFTLLVPTLLYLSTQYPA